MSSRQQEAAPAGDRNPQGDLDYVYSEIIHCDDEFCPDLKDMYMDGLFLALELKFPEIHRDLSQCAIENRPDEECTPIFIEGINKVNPFFFKELDEKRQKISPDPLQGYDGIKYGSPFWFEGAGDIWRRTTHKSTKTSVKDCAKVRKDSEECLADSTKPNDYCYRLYGHALACEPGTNCPYLRFPILKCLQESHLVDYNKLKACVDAIPNYTSCTKAYVPQTK